MGHQRYSKEIGLCSRKPDVVSLYGDIDPKSRATRMEVHRETYRLSWHLYTQPPRLSVIAFKFVLLTLCEKKSLCTCPVSQKME